MFDGTLGTRNTTPVDLELKEDAKPVRLPPYPVLRVHKEIFIKEVERLVSFGVINESNNSKWGAPTFSDQNKIKLCQILELLWNLNMKLKRNPYHMPKIHEMILNLKGF